MFQSENDELIPRCAPTPSTSNEAASIFRPSVPEISIVFTQKQSEQLSCSSSSETTSYSVWKNKCLPSVSCPPEANALCSELSSKSKRSNAYPLRTEDVVIPPFNYITGQIPVNKSEFINKPNKNAGFSLKKTYFIEAQENILTVSAGTQTDNFLDNANEFNISTLATKEDIAEIKSMMLKMETEQRQLLKALQDLLKGKFDIDTIRPKFRDIGIQNDERFNEEILFEEPIQINYNLKEGNSTDYHLSKVQTASTNIMTEIQKTATEQSIVMNELAVKYLPNSNLNDMLQDVPKPKQNQISYESSLKNIENFGKNATDLSTASYKYLRKYRLLSEENNNLSPRNDLLKLKSEDKLENMLDLEIIRCKPKFI